MREFKTSRDEIGIFRSAVIHDDPHWHSTTFEPFQVSQDIYFQLKENPQCRSVRSPLGSVKRQPIVSDTGTRIKKKDTCTKKHT